MWRLSKLTSRPSLLRFASTNLSQSQATSVSVAEDGKKLHLLTEGELERRYHSVWLRHNCRCIECLSPTSWQNIVHHSHLMDLKISDANLIDEGSVEVKWDSATGPHSCQFDIQWLKKYDYTSPGIHEERRSQEYPLVTDTLPETDYKEVISSKEGFYKWLKQINFYGLSLLTNVPTVDKEVERVSKKIADPQTHAYVPVFDVVAKEDVDDAAYSSDDLIMHMDQGYFESSPGIQVLHCLKFDDCVEGGETLFVDGFPIVEQLRRDYPKKFKTLTQVPYWVQRVHQSLDNQDDPIWIQYGRPHIVLDRNDRIVGINWSPQFHAPLQVPEDEVEEYYDAFILLSNMFENSPLKIKHRFRPGDLIAFNNRRVLHARNAFKLNGGVRHLQGLYLNIDFFRSRYLVLANQLKTGENTKHVFNHSWIA